MVSIAKGMETRNGNALCSITGVIARKQNDSEFLRCDYFNLLQRWQAAVYNSLLSVIFTEYCLSNNMT